MEDWKFETTPKSYFQENLFMKLSHRAVDYYNLCKELRINISTNVTKPACIPDKISRSPSSFKLKNESAVFTGNIENTSSSADSHLTQERKTEKLETVEQKKQTLIEIAKECNNIDEVKALYMT